MWLPSTYAKHWYKKLQGLTDSCTSHRDVAEVVLPPSLTLSKTTNFRLFQTERVVDVNFKFD